MLQIGLAINYLKIEWHQQRMQHYPHIFERHVCNFIIDCEKGPQNCRDYS